jgi:polyhydroxyalkanoate synthase
MADPARRRGTTPATDDVSRHFLATLAQWTGGLSPQAFGGAWLSVLARLATAPGRQAALARSALAKSLALAQFSGAALKGEPPRAEGTPYANRFADPAWAKFPFNLMAQSFLSASEWAREAVKNVPGADPAAENIVGFTVREGLELVAPDNYLPTNPQLIKQTVDENGRNLARGLKHLAEDVGRTF